MGLAKKALEATERRSDWLIVKKYFPSVLILPLSVVKELSNLRAFAA